MSYKIIFKGDLLIWYSIRIQKRSFTKVKKHMFNFNQKATIVLIIVYWTSYMNLQ